MRKTLATSAFLVITTGLFAQIPQLKLADQKAEDLIGKNAKRAPFVDPLAYVNPFVGTGGHGHTFPGPVVPFGMVQLGPDTRPEGWDGCSGYHYSDSVIYGFSHTHLSGTGIPDYSDLLVVPQVGKVKLQGAWKTPKGYGAKFSHKNETASPGYYSVKLQDPDVDVRLTTTERCGIHEYTFHTEKGKKYLVLDLGYRDRVIETSAAAEGKNHVRGYRISEAWASKQYFYFDLETNIPFSKARWVEDKKTGTHVMVLEFPADTKQVLLRVGISGTDKEGASKNLQAEGTSWDFEQYLRNAQTRWRTELSVVQAYASQKEVLNNFYTALYHAYIHPSLWTDTDGRYRDFNQQVQHSSEGDLYSVFSLWDTYRGANPLYTIFQQDRVPQFVESFYQQYRNTGLLPVWTLSDNETNCMIGYHAVSVIADAHGKGIRLKHTDELLKAMIATSNHDHFGKRQFVQQGFISANTEPESVSRTLEYSYDDWCIAQFARRTGNDSVAAVYEKRAASWMNLYNPESGFFQPRKGGMWLPNFRPNEVNHHFTEANAWQYSLAAPHHIASVIRLKGGNQGMERFLDSLFYSSSVMSGREQADITGLIGQYAHGNEPSHHMAYLYNYCGAPYKTQQMIDRILKEHYHNTPDGLSGNEDCGQMSSWYVLSSLGFYPVSPGSPTYAIGRPMMDRVSLNIGSVPLVIEAANNAPDNKYIQAVSWNGEPYEKLYITQEMINEGGYLKIEMGPSPKGSLAKYELDLKDQAPKDAIAAPFFIASGTTFGENITVSLDKLPSETGTIVYTTNGDDPTEASATADKNLTLFETTTLKARIYRKEGAKLIYSPVVATTFMKYTQDKVIDLKTPYANQYSGGGAQGLVDGQFGGLDYRGTEWQGFQGKDVEAVVTLTEPRQISSISVSCFQDTKAWIFHPKSLTVEVSEDGITYKKVGTTRNSSVDDRREGATINPIRMDFPPVAAKYVRIRVENYGLCPQWHLGAGGETWLFLDEIVVE
jgi:predicted alpha-1,2-mannosidase